MTWWKRISEGIHTPTAQKKETPEGLWYNCAECKETITAEDHQANLWVCTHCSFHSRIGASEYFSFLFDGGKYKELNSKLISADPLKFTDTKPYIQRLRDAKAKTGLKDAIKTAYGLLNSQKVVVCCMEFAFVGGSMGSVVGEKIARAIDYCMRYKYPLIIISKSGGARMMEASFSLMQMAKTSAKLMQLSKAKIPYLSVLTDPTTGGVTASFAMLGDLNIAEPKALIGFAGPRVIKETIGKELPKGFQRSEFLLEKGFLDFITPRAELKEKLSQCLDFFKN